MSGVSESGDQIPPLVDENSAGGSLVVGAVVPALTTPFENVPFLKAKIRNAKVQWSMEDVPERLRDVNHSDWSNGKLLQKTFKYKIDGRQRPVQSSRQYPHCLIMSATTVQDRLILMSWWAPLGKDSKKEVMTLLAGIFRAPTVSSSPRRTRGADFTGSFDNAERVSNYADTTASARLSAKAPRRQVGESPKTNGQLYDRQTRRHERKVQKHSLALAKATVPSQSEGTNVSGEYKHLSITVRTVPTPDEANGNVSDQLLPAPRIEIVASDAEFATFAGANLTSWVTNTATQLTYGNQDKSDLPAEKRRAKRRRMTRQTMADTSGNPLSSTTVSPDEL